ncbi:uncharacterized protein LOC128718513 [Anopheles marshallii]|uniref:uncharacterized protein LOC128718513 n=1 Tax=Anopheles marshallii TaxID=1521116 RepID=UPI00237AFD98|nr:uncharacterized protein LOC128718513 [Anopheles marshallii]
MPYSVVEIIGNTESKKLLTVPETWIVSKNDAIGYLYWPGVKSDVSLKEMMANEHSTPSASWGKKICKIIYRGIPSLTSAQKTLEILQKQYKLNIRVITRGVKKNDQHSMNPIQNTASCRAVQTFVAKDLPTSNATQQLYNYMNPLEDEDPFGDLPVPKLSTENLYTCCDPKEENDPFGDLFPVTSQLNLATESNPTRNKPLNEPAFAVGESDDPSGNDAQNWSSRAERLDPPEDVKHSSQLYDLIYELKNIIISNKEEIKQNIRESFNRMQETILTLITQNAQMGSNHTESKTAELGDCYVHTLKTVEDVKRLDDQLRNTEFRKKVITFVDSNIQYETKPLRRMKIIFDMLFDGNLFYQLNWTGKYGKHQLKKYFNIRKLFEYIGSTSMHRSSQAEVSNFFIKTFYNRMRGLIQAQGKGISRNAEACSSKTIDSTQEKTIPNVLLDAKYEGIERKDTAKKGKRIEQDKMIEESESIAQDESMEHDESMEQDEGENRQTLSNVDSSHVASSGKILTEKYVKRITCVQELDTFEEQLNDVKVKQQVQIWIEKTVGPVTNVDKRMNDLLDRLIDKKVLRTFSWMDANSGKLPLESYDNFVKLFEYASRSVIHHTIIFNHGYVSNFFLNCISNIEG